MLPEREQFVEISPYGPAHEMPILPSTEIGIQCVQQFPGITVHPRLGQTVCFRDTVTIDLKFGVLPLLFLGLLCRKCVLLCFLGTDSLIFGALPLGIFGSFCSKCVKPILLGALPLVLFGSLCSKCD